MNTVVCMCNDEQRNQYVKLLKDMRIKYNEGGMVCGFSSYSDCCEKITENGHSIDLVFIGTSSCRENAVDLINRSRSVGAQVVLVGDKVDYAFCAFDMKVFSFILNGEVELASKLDSVYGAVIKLANKKNSDTILIPSKGFINCVPALEVQYFKVNNKRIVASCIDGEEFEFYSKFATLEANLKELSFLRIQRSLIVNVRHIIYGDDTTVKLKGGQEFPVGRCHGMENFSEVF